MANSISPFDEKTYYRGVIIRGAITLPKRKGGKFLDYPIQRTRRISDQFRYGVFFHFSKVPPGPFLAKRKNMTPLKNGTFKYEVIAAEFKDKSQTPLPSGNISQAALDKFLNNLQAMTSRPGWKLGITDLSPVSEGGEFKLGRIYLDELMDSIVDLFRSEGTTGIGMAVPAAIWLIGIIIPMMWGAAIDREQDRLDLEVCPEGGEGGVPEIPSPSVLYDLIKSLDAKLIDNHRRRNSFSEPK